MRRFAVQPLLVAVAVGAVACGSADAPPTAGDRAPASAPASRVSVDELHAAAASGVTETLRDYLAAGADPGLANAEGRTALMLASFDGHTAAARALIDGGADVNHRDAAGRSALIYASTGPFPETVEMLLAAGADPQVTDHGERFTALMHAAAEGHAEVVEVLLRYGADPAAVDVDGDTALTFARQNGHTDVVAALQ